MDESNLNTNSIGNTSKLDNHSYLSEKEMPRTKFFLKEFLSFLKKHWRTIVFYFVPISLVLFVFGVFNSLWNETWSNKDLVDNAFNPTVLMVVITIIAMLLQLIYRLIGLGSDIVLYDLDNGVNKGVFFWYKKVFKKSVSLVGGWFILTASLAPLFFIPIVLGIFMSLITGLVILIGIPKAVMGIISLVLFLIGILVFFVFIAIFSTRMAFFSYSVMIEDKRALDAIVSSYLYVKGKTGKVLWRLIISSVLSVLVPILISLPLIIKYLNLFFSGKIDNIRSNAEMLSMLGLTPSILIVYSALSTIGILIFSVLFTTFGYTLWKQIKAVYVERVPDYFSKTKKRIKISAWFGGILFLLFVGLSTILPIFLLRNIPIPFLPESQNFTYNNYGLGFSVQYPNHFLKNENLDISFSRIDFQSPNKKEEYVVEVYSVNEFYKKFNIQEGDIKKISDNNKLLQFIFEKYTAAATPFIDDFKVVSTSTVMLGSREVLEVNVNYSLKDNSRSVSKFDETYYISNENQSVYLVSAICADDFQCNQKQKEDFLNSFTPYYDLQVEDDFLIYHSPEYGVSVKLPKDWSTGYNNPEIGYFARFFVPNGINIGSYYENVVISAIKFGGDLERLKKNQGKMYKKTDDFIVDKIEDIIFAGLPGFKMSASFKDENGERVNYIAYTTIKDGIAYSLNYFVVNPKTISKIEVMADSFTIQKPLSKKPDLSIPGYGVSIQDLPDGVETSLHPEPELVFSLKLKPSNEEDVYSPVFIFYGPFLSSEDSLERNLREGAIQAETTIDSISDEKIAGLKAFCGKSKPKKTDLGENVFSDVVYKECYISKQYITWQVFYFDNKEDFDSSFVENKQIFDSLIIK